MNRPKKKKVRFVEEPEATNRATVAVEPERSQRPRLSPSQSPRWRSQRLWRHRRWKPRRTPPAPQMQAAKRGRPPKVRPMTPQTMPAWLLEKKAQEAAEAVERKAAMALDTAKVAEPVEATADVQIVGERDAVQSAADRLSAAQARGEVVELEGDA